MNNLTKMQEADRRLWRALRHAFSHSLGSRGEHDDQNLEQFMEALEDFIEAKIRESEIGKP